MMVTRLQDLGACRRILLLNSSNGSIAAIFWDSCHSTICPSRMCIVRPAQLAAWESCVTMITVWPSPFNSRSRANTCSPVARSRLPVGSPAEDAGLPIPWLTADLEGNPRPQGDGYDIGAWEGVAEPWRVYLPLVLK